MHPSLRTIPVALVLLLLSLGVSGCGDGDESSGSSTGSKSARSKEKGGGAPLPEPGSQEAVEKSGASVFTDTPELEACMTAAGFADDAPSTGAIKAWRHPDGARAAVGSGPDVAGIADEFGAVDTPTEVDGTVVLSGPSPLRDAAARCLEGAAS